MDLRAHSARFASEAQSTLAGVLPGTIEMVSIEHAGRFVVRPKGESVKSQRIPLFIDGEELASLSVHIYLDQDRTGQYLKAWKSTVGVFSSLDRTPLIRNEFDAHMSESAPLSHWHVHAERGSMSHLLARAHAVRDDVVKKPHDLSSLHIPVGGERFRPCLEDVLEFLVRDCGIDSNEGWSEHIRRGRERWRRTQFRSAVRDLQEEAAAILTKEGWTVVPPDRPLTEGGGILFRW